MRIASLAALIADPTRARMLTALMGVDLVAVAKRPLCRTCLDWRERRPHLAGGLGAAILVRLFGLQWARRELTGRAVAFSPAGEEAFRQAFSSRRTIISWPT